MHRSAAVALMAVLPLVAPREAEGQQMGAAEVLIPRGDYQIHGRLFRARGPETSALVVLLPGIPGSGGDVLGLGSALANVGLHVLTFDYSGTHGSGGLWSIGNDQGDVRAVLDHVRSVGFAQRYGFEPAPIHLGGYSHGGGVALLFAARSPDVSSVFSIAGNDLGEWGRRTIGDPGFAEAVEGLFARYESEGLIRPAPGADRELIDNLERYDVRLRAAELAGRRILLVAGLDDATTPLEDHGLPLYRALRAHGAHDVRFVLVQDDHSLTDVENAVAGHLIDWLRDRD